MAKKGKDSKRELKVEGVLYVEGDIGDQKPKKKKRKKKQSTRKSVPKPIPKPRYLDYWQRFQKPILVGAGCLVLGVGILIYALTRQPEVDHEGLAELGYEWTGEKLVEIGSRQSEGSGTRSSFRGRSSVVMERAETRFSGRRTGGTISVSRTDSRIRSTTTWPRATYVLDSDLDVSEGSVLRIESGSTLKFKTGRGMSLKGPIKAVGLEDEVITFAPEDKKWRGIKIEGTRANDSLFEYCIIRDTNGSYGSSMNIRDFDLDPRDPKSREKIRKMMKGGTHAGVYVKDASPTFRHCMFENNRSKVNGGAMFLHNFNGLVEDCIFQKNQTEDYYGGAICLKGMCFSARILRNKFLNNRSTGRGGALAAFINCRNRMQIVGNYFVGNSCHYKKDKHMYCAQNIVGETFIDWPIGTKKDNQFD